MTTYVPHDLISTHYHIKKRSKTLMHSQDFVIAKWDPKTFTISSHLIVATHQNITHLSRKSLYKGTPIFSPVAVA